MEVAYREPNGRASRAREPADKLALEIRARRLGISVVQAKDQKAASFIGYLNILGPRDGLSDTQHEALAQYLKVRGNYLLAIKAPDAMADNKATGGSGDAISDEYVEWCQKAVKDHDAARKAIYTAQDENRLDNLWAALDLCVIQGQHLHHMVGTVRVLGNALAKHFRC